MDTKVLKGFGIFLLIFVLVVVGLVVYDNMTRVEVLKQDHVSDVTFVEDKKNMYIFWGNGCSHCEELRVFLEDQADLWRDDYQIFSFETWDDEENATLMNDILALLDRENEGTPTVIIGDTVLVGYGDDMQAEYQSAFEQEKNTDYDVVKEYLEQ